MVTLGVLLVGGGRLPGQRHQIGGPALELQRLAGLETRDVEQLVEQRRDPGAIGFDLSRPGEQPLHGFRLAHPGGLALQHLGVAEAGGERILEVVREGDQERFAGPKRLLKLTVEPGIVQRQCAATTEILSQGQVGRSIPAPRRGADECHCPERLPARDQRHAH